MRTTHVVMLVVRIATETATRGADVDAKIIRHHSATRARSKGGADDGPSLRDRKRSEIWDRKAGHSFVTPRIPPTVDHAISQATFLVRNLVSFLTPPNRNQRLRRLHRSRRLASPRPPSPTSGAGRPRGLPRAARRWAPTSKQARPAKCHAHAFSSATCR
jgi:hypothetical protein